MGTSITGYAAYVPAYRLGRDSGARSRRVVASFDENSTTMAVAAARNLPVDALAADPDLWFATTSPAYLDKTNATAIHAALGLAPSALATDAAGSSRSTVGALRGAAATGGLVVAADVRVGRPGSADERLGGDAAAALVFGDGPAIADIVAHAHSTAEFLDTWRPPSATVAAHWEERFGYEQYVALIDDAVPRALAQAGVSSADHAVVVSPNSAIVKRAGSLVPAAQGVVSPVGYSGAADLLLGLADVLDRAEPDQTVLLVSAADGCDVWVLRTTAALVDRRQPVPVARQLDGGIEVPYPVYLSWRGLLDREPPRRPEPDRPAAPPSSRGAGWKFGLIGARCRECGFVHLPPVPLCRQCHSGDMEPAPVSRLRGRVATFTVDRLAFSPSPPVVDVVVDFEGGGRCTVEVADAQPEQVRVGAEVEMVFRSLFVADGVQNYFWKARIVDDAHARQEDA
ncbi:OB-fold domain-containing protein [uncultured Gordonia sp.]|uniref:OB-fold domain-containing protein n=3 Tax=unclassified Gordonia (in: high G+C Gram-positive bacteria) TaxID=2657482 RepID=UPI000F9079E1|nr:OB-fold domain-containing protein [uncultured Gordonia sp.]RUP41392.1 MAG: hydroxymethylglutaryl-CoA synthase [Gordonia sp. (in: high G+C Gram-positive bacteria)]